MGGWCFWHFALTLLSKFGWKLSVCFQTASLPFCLQHKTQGNRELWPTANLLFHVQSYSVTQRSMLPYILPKLFERRVVLSKENLPCTCISNKKSPLSFVVSQHTPLEVLGTCFVYKRSSMTQQQLPSGSITLYSGTITDQILLYKENSRINTASLQNTSLWLLYCHLYLDQSNAQLLSQLFAGDGVPALNLWIFQHSSPFQGAACLWLVLIVCMLILLVP